MNDLVRTMVFASGILAGFAGSVGMRRLTSRHEPPAPTASTAGTVPPDTNRLLSERLTDYLADSWLRLLHARPGDVEVIIPEVERLTGRMMLSPLCATAAEIDPEGTLRAILHLRGINRGAAAGGFFRRWAELDPAAAERAVASLTDAGLRRTARFVIDSHLNRLPPSSGDSEEPPSKLVTEWTQRFGSGSVEARTAALEAVPGTLSVTDFQWAAGTGNLTDAVRWLAGIPQPAARVALFKLCGTDNPESIVQLLGALPEGGARTACLRRWAVHAPHPDWLKRLPAADLTAALAALRDDTTAPARKHEEDLQTVRESGLW